MFFYRELSYNSILIYFRVYNCIIAASSWHFCLVNLACLNSNCIEDYRKDETEKGVSDYPYAKGQWNIPNADKFIMEKENFIENKRLMGMWYGVALYNTWKRNK